jgi:type IV pilus assembly protein PilX
LPQAQHGVVLVIALILLVLISLLAVTSLRNAGSSESVAGNVRTTELATQAADIALRYCESKALEMATAGVTPDSTPDQWKTPAAWDAPNTKKPWDGTSTSAFVLPATFVNQAGMTYDTYKRPPECMVEKLPAVTTSASMFYLITARGFGPGVAAADATRSRPNGSEVWLQSSIELQ